MRISVSPWNSHSMFSYKITIGCEKMEAIGQPHDGFEGENSTEFLEKIL